MATGEQRTRQGLTTYPRGVAPVYTLDSVSPSTGSEAGGTIVTVEGTEFETGMMKVRFAGSLGTAVSVLNDTSLLCLSPAHAAGAVDVQLFRQHGVTLPPPTLEDGFTYGGGASTLTAVNPEYGLDTGGHTVVLSGSDFSGSPVVLFGGTPATNVVVVNGATITCTVPAHAIGVVDIEVSGATLADTFEYFTASTSTIVGVTTFEAFSVGTVSSPFSQLAPWNNGASGGGVNAISDTYARPGRTKSLKCTLTDNTFAGVIKDGISNSQFQAPGGVWSRSYHLTTQATIDATWVSGQMKMVKMNDSPGSGSSYFSSLLGAELATHNSAGDFTVAGTNPGAQPITGTMVDEEWVEIIVGAFRFGNGTGRVVVFVDGVKTNDLTAATIGDDTSNNKNMSVGGHYSQAVVGAVDMWIDDAEVRDGAFV